MSKKILIVAAHADDEVLGCGGTINRHVCEGDKVHLVLMADGVNSRLPASAIDFDNRAEALCLAQLILGISSVTSFGFPDNKMDAMPLLEIVKQLEAVINRIGPDIIYTHFHGDLNIDHRLTYLAVMTACRPIPNCSVQEIYGFEVLSSTEWSTVHSGSFCPTHFVDIGGYVPVKLKALAAYHEEMRPVPHSRSIEHAKVLALHRGYSVGLEAAEAFVVYRVLRKELQS